MIVGKVQFDICEVSPEQLREVIKQYVPRGLFLAREGCNWIAMDNSTGDAWTEEFPRKRQAVRWLRGAEALAGTTGLWKTALWRRRTHEDPNR